MNGIKATQIMSQLLNQFLLSKKKEKQISFKKTNLLDDI
jgi:hypothetical protein